MKSLTLLFVILLTQVSCADDAYTIQPIKRDEISNLVDVPQVKILQEQDLEAEGILDRFPFRPILHRPKPPVEADKSMIDSLVDGEILKKIKDSILKLVDALTWAISFIIYLTPVAIMGYFGGFFFGGIAAVIYGLAYLRRSIRSLRGKPTVR